MKIYISVDMEGIAGVVNWKETFHGEEDFGRFRKLMTAEANAAATAAFDEGAEVVVINDAHGSMRNLVIEELDSRVELISGSPKPMSMVQGLDADFDGVLFIGYHSMAGTPGVLNHTYTDTLLEYRVNGQLMGEIGMNAAVAGHFDVPVLFLSGDDCAVAEEKELLNGVGTACVKRYASRYAARSLHPHKSRQLIYEGVREAMGRAGEVEPLKVETPVVVSLRFSNTALADGSLLLPGAERVDPVTVQYQAPDYPGALKAARALISLGR